MVVVVLLIVLEICLWSDATRRCNAAYLTPVAPDLGPAPSPPPRAGVFLDSYVWIWWRLIGICASER